MSQVLSADMKSRSFVGLSMICVVLMLASGCGGGGSSSAIIAPEAAFTATPSSGVYDLEVTFTENNIGEVESRQWDFGDGGTSTEQDPTHIYTTPGTYSVSLTVIGPGGEDTFTCDSCILVQELPPTAGFDVTPTSGTYDLLVSFTDASTGVISSRLWDFGDGTTSDEVSPSHLYTAAGSYSVSLTVTGPGGGDLMVCDSCITVLDPPPVAGFLATPTSGAGPLEVEFTDQSSGLISSRSWDFGDPDSGSENSSDLASPFHLYQQPGTYQVTLVVTGPGGDDTSICSSCVVVTDEGDPQILDMPLDIVLGTDPGVCQAIASWVEPTAIDNFGLSTLVSDYLPGDTFPLGETLVTYTATDLAGNSTSSSFVVTVEDNETPQLVGMPSDVTIESLAGSCTAVHLWNQPAAIDNCGVATVTYDLESGTTLPLGDTTVTYSVTDINGNLASSSFTVTVVDTETPTISGLPAEMILQNDPGTCNAVVSWVDPTITDNCGVVSSGADFASGDSFSLGTTTVTYTATDNSGNSSSVAFTVTVEDGEAPVISGMPGDMSVENDPGSCGALVTWSEPGLEDNCPGSSISSDRLPGSLFEQGTNTVTYTATDQAGNTSSSTFTISVIDGESPLIAGIPGDMEIENDPGACGAVVNWAEPTASDNCGVTSFASDAFNGAMFPLGDTVVSYLALDENGNATSESFVITVLDTESPTMMALPTDTEIFTDPGLCSGIATWSDPVAIDNCNISSLTADHQSGESLPRGLTTITYTATDDAGNSTSVSFTITVIDTEEPIISGMPMDLSVETASGTCSAAANWTDPIVSENCGSFTLEVDHSPGSVFSVGSTMVTYTAFDSSGNSSSSFFTVTVLDTESPTISGLPLDLIVENSAGDCGAEVTWADPRASDNCMLLSLTGDHVSGSFFPVGKSLVSYLATDESGNTTSDSFTITVLDVEMPIVMGTPTDIQLSTLPGTCSATATWSEPVATDNCSVQEVVSNHSSGDRFSLGLTVVTYMVTDGHSNSTSVSFNVNVVDEEDPTISSIPGDLTLENISGTCSAPATWIEPTASDNCGSVTLISDQSPGSEFPVGSTIVTYTALDDNGNSSSNFFTVTVLDTESPSIFGNSQDQVASNDAGSCGAVVSWTEPTASDNCGVTSFSASHDSGSTFPLGETMVSYTALDADGNGSTFSFTITVIDDENPNILGTPTSISIATEPGVCSSTANWTEPMATDNCELSSLTSDYSTGSQFPVGDTTVTYTATDLSGNMTTSSFLVTVSDTEAPQITEVPANITITAELGEASAVVTWIDPIVNDNCGPATLTSNFLSGDSFPIGSTQVLFSAIDGAGNESSEFFTVFVNAMAPSANFIATNISGTYPLTVDFVDTSTGLITDWMWDFGDGTTSASQSPTHLYTQEGSYTVTLVVSGPGGSSSMICQPCIQVTIPPDYLLKLEDGSMQQGMSSPFSIKLDNNGGDIQAWSYGVCHDKGKLTCIEVIDGDSLAILNNGAPPDFTTIQIRPDGFTAGVVVSFTSSYSLTPGFNYEINRATYQGDVVGVTMLEFCDTLGNPSISTVVVVDGQTLIPDCASASVEVLGNN